MKSVESNLNQVQNTFVAIQNQLSTFAEDLTDVLAKHEQDFLTAYKLHMQKIEKELLSLKNKSKDQDLRMTQDTRIVVLERQLEWFKNEFECLLKVKATQD